MKLNLKKEQNQIAELFKSFQETDLLAWDIVNEFLHVILTQMERLNINKAELAKRLNLSRSAVSQMLNSTPSNITIKKMVETADAVGLKIQFDIDTLVFSTQQKYVEIVEPHVIYRLMYSPPERNIFILTQDHQHEFNNICPDSDETDITNQKISPAYEFMASA